MRYIYNLSRVLQPVGRQASIEQSSQQYCVSHLSAISLGK